MSKNSYNSSLLIPKLKMHNNEAMFALQKNDTALANAHIKILNRVLTWEQGNLAIKKTLLPYDNIEGE